MLTMMFKGENVAIELCNALPTLHGQLKVGDGGADIGLDLAPEERGILFSDIGGTAYPSL